MERRRFLSGLLGGLTGAAVVAAAAPLVGAETDEVSRLHDAILCVATYGSHAVFEAFVRDVAQNHGELFLKCVRRYPDVISALSAHFAWKISNDRIDIRIEQD